jgi:hypothetical protein
MKEGRKDEKKGRKRKGEGGTEAERRQDAEGRKKTRKKEGRGRRREAGSLKEGK